MSQPPTPPIFNIWGVEQLFPHGDSKNYNFPGRVVLSFCSCRSPRKKFSPIFLCFSTEVTSFSNQSDIYIIEITSANDKSETEKYISMNNRLIVRLTENELKDIMGKCVRRALIKEHVDMQREIKLAQQALCKFPLSDVGLRLEGTRFYKQYQKMKDAAIELNNALIQYIRGEGKN